MYDSPKMSNIQTHLQTHKQFKILYIHGQTHKYGTYMVEYLQQKKQYKLSLRLLAALKQTNIN